MKIGIVIKHCCWSLSSNFLLELLPYFTKRHSIHIFAGKWDKANNKRVHFHKVPVFFSNFFLQELFFSISSTIIMKNQTFDATIAQPTRYMSPDIALMQFCYKGWDEYKKKMGLKLTFAERLSPIIEKYNLKKCKKIIATSEGIKKEVMEFYQIPENKIVVIPNGVNPKECFFTKKERMKLREKLGFSKDDKILLFVGRNLKRKGLEYVLKSLPMVKEKNMKLIICGGDDEYHRGIVRELNQEDRVIFVGDVKNVPEYCAIGDVFVFPTFYEGFSFATLEAAASGLPVIAAVANGTEDLIENGKNGFLLKDRKPETIANKINQLFEDDNLRARMGKNARKTILEKYSFDKIAKQILEVIDEVVK
jgi:UDP-glucose:(heptosyl)LPS alpha-1,3-glucosyltransferase